VSVTAWDLAVMVAAPVECEALKDSRHKTAAASRELADWLDYLDVGNKALRTRLEYERILAVLLRAYPDRRFHEFTDRDLAHVLAGIPRASRKQHKSVYNRWFKWGIVTELLDRNPVDKLPEIQHRTNRSYDLYSDTEVAALTALPQPDGALCGLLFWTGIRLAEARGLTMKRIDFDRRMVLVLEGAKGSKQRRVPLIAPVAQALAAMETLEGLGPDDYLWYTINARNKRLIHKREISDGRFYLWWRDCHRRAGIRYRRPHLARHTFATKMRELGLPIDELSQILGHESVETTDRTYVHRSTDAIGDHMRELYEAAEVA